MTQGRPLGEDGRSADTLSTWVMQPMSTTTPVGKTDTTDESAKKMAYVREDGALVPVGEIEVGR